MMFQLNRVQYDYREQKLVKDLQKFDFDKEIYLDLFLNNNREESDKYKLKLVTTQKKLRQAKDKLDAMTIKNDIVSKFEDVK